MTSWQAPLLAAAAAATVYSLTVVSLLLAGRRRDVRAVAGLVPDCLVLFRRLLGDPRVPRSRKLLLAGLIAYLALPVDLVPDFIPIAGQLDDAIIAALVLRALLRSAGPNLLDEHWPGPPASLGALTRLS